MIKKLILLILISVTTNATAIPSMPVTGRNIPTAKGFMYDLWIFEGEYQSNFNKIVTPYIHNSKRSPNALKEIKNKLKVVELKSNDNGLIKSLQLKDIKNQKTIKDLKEQLKTLRNSEQSVRTYNITLLNHLKKLKTVLSKIKELVI